MQKKNILLIDDDEINNFYVLHILKKIDTIDSVSIALNGQEGLVKLKELNANNSPIDVILLDVNMPIMNGFDFLDKYQDMPTNLKAKKLIALIASASDSADFNKLATYNTVDHAMEKPLTEETLIKLLSDL